MGFLIIAFSALSRNFPCLTVFHSNFYNLSHTLIFYLFTMKLYIADIPEEGLSLNVVEEKVTPDFIVSPVQASLEIRKAGTQVCVKGCMTATVKLSCSRCLEDFSREISVPVDVVYYPVKEIQGDETYEIKTEELNMGFYSDDEIELPDLMSEQIMLNVPMKPLCSDECRGICSGCGADLSSEACECAEAEGDPRFGVLRKLLERKDS